MQRKITSAAFIFTDVLIVIVTPFLSLYLRFDGVVDTGYFLRLLPYLPLIILVNFFVFYFFKLYHRLWRYASIHELLIIISAVSISTSLLTGVMLFSGVALPRSVYFLSWIFNICFIGGSRLAYRILHYFIRMTQSKAYQNVLIVGAGDAGAMIAREITQRYYETKKLIGFIDDSAYKENQILFGAKVLGTSLDIQRVVHDYEITEIIIAIPSVGGQVIRDIVQKCKKTECTVRIVPGIYELIDGKVSLQQLRKVALEDLLRRDPVQLDIKEITQYLTGKRILVTGAGGSIGSELCRQIAKMNPRSLMLLGKGENSIFLIERELRGLYNDFDIIPTIADVRDRKRMEKIFQQYQPEVVFHAAAHKHVPLMESQPVEAVKNNIFGTKTVAEVADANGTETFVMISTDKAVNPTSVMGATKRVAELIIQNLSKKSNTRFVAVRFGNVLGSRGSVVPLFKDQIAKGGPITITHPDMKRYFMTIPEASQLVLQAGAIAHGGEVFVLDMGEPVKILDMACDLIELSGLVPYKDIKINFTGLRPGEKLFEELLTAEEGTTSTRHDKIYIANLKVVNEDKLIRGLEKLQIVDKSETIAKILATLVPTYHSQTWNVNSLIQMEQRGLERESDHVIDSREQISQVLISNE